MPDLTMCPGTDCPLKEGCFRYRAKPTPLFQSYFQEAPYDKDHCNFFEPIKEKAALDFIDFKPRC